ncbi:protein kinase domain-containing protein [Pseudofrankia sp. BMG5.37]|uniref:protein kinase domain-containing protein n=1 Tax=Pseudofrankia sp. BMG5.37 TaxID=3050035 RepID=UPI002895BC1B|nr:protein kinase [Pseudofrankia sp. BMG5.37]MDT3442444.1 protein kinase [Pseudofrankia sp. BMG5.37]
MKAETADTDVVLSDAVFEKAAAAEAEPVPADSAGPVIDDAETSAEPGFSLRGGDPELIGRYRVLRLLGEGGMGSVFLGESPEGRRVAVKVIRSDYARVPEFRTRFGRETAHVRRVAKFCTAEVVDADPDANLPYLVTEFIPGPTLGEAVAADGPLAESDLERLGVSMAAALTAIHAAGIAHRDLKPSNVLLGPSGPRVIDFGIASTLGATTMVSQDVTRIGTPAYMAPEQIRGGKVGAAADIFAWAGVMLYAATGRPPFGEAEPIALLYRVIHDDPDLTGVPDGIVELVRQAFRKNPDERPTATGLLLRLLGDAEPIADQRSAVARALDGWHAGAAGVGVGVGVGQSMGGSGDTAMAVGAGSAAAAPGGIRLTKPATGPGTARRAVSADAPAGVGTGATLSDYPTLVAGSAPSGASGAAAPYDDPAGDLSGLEPVVALPGGGEPPSLTRRRGSRVLPRRGAAQRSADRSKRLAPAIVALVAMVALAGITVPLALRASDRDTYLTSDGQDVTNGATVDAPSGKDRNAGGDGGTTGGGDVSSPGGVDAIGAAGRGPVRTGQSRPAGGTTSGRGGAPSSGGSAGQSDGSDQSNDSGQSNGVQPGGGTGNTGGTSTAPQGDAPTLQPPGTPGMRVVSVSGGVQVTITAPTSGGAPTTYVITADPGGTKSLPSPGTVTIQVDGCARSTVSARASNAAGTSPTATAAALGCVTPSAPSNVTVRADSYKSYTARWSPAARTGGTGVVVDYVVRIYLSHSMSSWVSEIIMTGTSYTFEYNAGNVLNKVTIATRNPAGQSAEVTAYREPSPDPSTTPPDPSTSAPAPSTSKT